MCSSLLAKFSPCVGRSSCTSPSVDPLRSNLESVCSLVLSFRGCRLIVFKYSAPFPFWKSFLQNMMQREKNARQTVSHRVLAAKREVNSTMREK